MGLRGGGDTKLNVRVVLVEAYCDSGVVVVLFILQKSEHEFLNCVGDDLSDIIGQKDKRNIKNQLVQIVKHYPDFRSA